MPKPIKKRVSRQPVLKEEEIRWSFTQILEFMRQKRKILLFGAIAVIGIVALLLIGIYYESSLKKKAHTLETEAYNYYYGIDLKEGMSEEERWKKALELYKKAVETRTSPTALLYLGNCYYNLSDYAKAIEEYERFIKRFGGEKELLPVVYQKLSSAYLKKGEKEKAFSTLNKLSELDNGIFKDTALILEARYYEVIGETDKAREKYNELINKFPASVWVNEAKTKTQQTEKK